MLGTIRFNSLNAVNRPGWKSGMKKLEHAELCSWVLIHILDKPHDNKTVAYRAEKFGFKNFKDRKLVTFFTNNLADTPRQGFEGQSEYAVSFVHELAPLHLWLGTEEIKRTAL